MVPTIHVTSKWQLESFAAVIGCSMELSFKTYLPQGVMLMFEQIQVNDNKILKQ